LHLSTRTFNKSTKYFSPTNFRVNSLLLLGLYLYHNYYYYYYYYYNQFTALWILSGTTWVSQYQKGKTNLDLLEQEIVSGSGISWAICKSAPCPRQITKPAFHHSVFTRRMPFLPPNQQRQSTEGHICIIKHEI